MAPKVGSVPLVQACQDARRAYRNWFDSLSGKRKGRTVGHPRFRSRKDHRQSIRLTRNGFALHGDRLYVGLGLRSRADRTKDPLALPRSDVIIWRCADGTKVALRPSGTEPKVKIYLQVVLSAAGHDDLRPLRAQAARRLARLREEVTEVLNL